MCRANNIHNHNKYFELKIHWAMFQNTFYTYGLLFFQYFAFFLNIRGSIILCLVVFEIFSQFLFVVITVHLKQVPTSVEKVGS